MSRLIPYPLLTLSLYGMWVLLTGFSVGHALLGLVIAIGVSRTMLTLQPEKPRIRFGMPMLRLFWRVLVDVVRSNFAVAGIILTGARPRQPSFVRIPLDLRDPYGLATLGIIICATPGTLWLQYDEEWGTLLIHVLDLQDEAALIAQIKQDYERPLMEIFE